MDYLDGFVVETEKARDTAVTVFNNFAAILKGMREQLRLAAEEIDQLERQRGALRAKLKAEYEDGHKQLEAIQAKTREAERQLEKTIKQNAQHKQEIRKILDGVIMGKAVA
jgi:chromosome segregation ATPase